MRVLNARFDTLSAQIAGIIGVFDERFGRVDDRFAQIDARPKDP